MIMNIVKLLKYIGNVKFGGKNNDEQHTGLDGFFPPETHWASKFILTYGREYKVLTLR